MPPSEALSASAQLAVALAGFAGVVVAFRSRSVHEWTNIDKFRLRILLLNSGMPFALSLIGMMLLTANISPGGIWRYCSGFAFLLIWLAAMSYSKSFRRFSPEELVQAGSSRALFYSAAAIGSAVTLLQLYNAIMLNAFWPFFAAIAVLLMIAMLQFVRLVLISGELK
ncbi:MAG: hypothetical protein DME34_11200 [Verrucomicrobia bacterium]|nr:MAG: hypothetical protein DME34_11200 [Verrucomicrobiota bacterium]